LNTRWSGTASIRRHTDYGTYPNKKCWFAEMLFSTKKPYHYKHGNKLTSSEVGWTNEDVIVDLFEEVCGGPLGVE